MRPSEAGLIRVREFTMRRMLFYPSIPDWKIWSSITRNATQHTERIFLRRVGVPEGAVSVKSDSGMMGGNISHSSCFLTPVGEGSIVLCDSCDYRANMEAAENISDIAKFAESAALEKVYTPNVHTIEERSAISSETRQRTPAKPLFISRMLMINTLSFSSAAISKSTRRSWSTSSASRFTQP